MKLSMLSLTLFSFGAPSMPLLRAWKLAVPYIQRRHLQAAQKNAFHDKYYVEGRDHPLQVRLREAITAIGVSQQWEEIAPAMAAARAAGVKPSVYAYSKAISVLAGARQFDAAVQQLQQMRLDGVQPNVVVVNCLLNACR
jgi:pentatricopeptide repeat protein